MCHNFHSIETIYVVADSVDVSIEIYTILARSVDLPRDCDGIDGHGETLSRHALLSSLTFQDSFAAEISAS